MSHDASVGCDTEQPTFLVCDGGGTSTRALVFSADGTMTASAIASESNATVLGLDACVRVLVQTILATNHAKRPFTIAWLGIAGADDRATCLRLHSLLLSSDPGLVARPEDLLVTNDADLLAAALPLHGASGGVCLIAGTGSNAVSFGPPAAAQMLPFSERGRIGGWGHILGDEGSAYWMGREAVRGVLAHGFDTRPAVLEADGAGSVIAPSAPFVRSLLELVGCQDVNDLLSCLHMGSSEAVKERIASVAPLVTRHATENDPFAGLVVQRACDFHMHVATTLLRSTLVTLRPVALILGGAIFNQCPDIAGKMEKAGRNAGFVQTVVVNDAADLGGKALASLWRQKQQAHRAHG